MRANKVILVTRAAVEWAGRTPSPEWFDHRIELSKQVAIPPVLKAIESGVDLHWVMQTCPERRDQGIEGYKDYDFISVVDQSEMTHDSARVNGQIQSVRIDSDDAVSPQALAFLSNLKWQQNHLLELVTGYQLLLPEWDLGVFDRSVSHTVPPFFAIAKTRRDALDVQGYHAQGRRPARRRRWRQLGAFIQTVGHGNVHNKWWAEKGRLDDERAKGVFEMFGITPPATVD